ncbi:gamma carbonic anhydrase family protein [Pseudogemmobacter sonorensis]|uniref:gamma carbonic anhydrase family protein n=1 Tax=Pseudogemmobacter sonorensis TaxID=2989681 RepID=UPI0036B32939
MGESRLDLTAPLDGVAPQIAASAFVAPGAVVIGAVTIGEGCSIWYGAVLRGDEEEIRIGARSNIQDGCIVHTTLGQGPTVVGSDVTIGHRAVLHGCRIGDGAMVGIGAIVLDGAVVEPGAMVGAGAVVSPGKVVTAGTLWTGCPARMARELRPTDLEFLRRNPGHYVAQAHRHRPLFEGKG